MNRNFILSIVVVLSGLLVLASTALAEKPIVYIVHSYEPNNVCGQPQADGVIASLKDQGLYPEKVTIESYYMDTKTTHTSPAAMAGQGALALKEIERLKPAVVVTLDDNAFKYVGLKLVDRPGVSVVFCGLNGQPEAYDKMKEFMDSRSLPNHNVTGVYEKLHLKRALTVLATVVSGLNKVVGITDYSPTGDAAMRQFEIESVEGLPVQWAVRRVGTFDEYKALIRELNEDDSVQAIYPVALTLKEKDGRVAAAEIFRWTIENSTKPEVPVNYYFCQLGLFGGASVDFNYMGKMAGIQVSSILGGSKAGALPIVEASNYAIVFNAQRARMLNITIPDEILLASDAVFKEAQLLK